MGRLRRRNDRHGGKAEGNAKHIGILNIEEPLLIQIVRLATTQGAANHLLAEELRAEGTNAEHVGNGIGIPPFGQQGDRDYAADRLAKPPLFANHKLLSGLFG